MHRPALLPGVEDAEMRRAKLIPLVKNTQCNKIPQSGWPIQPTLSPSGYRDALDGGPADSVPSESPLPRWLMSSIYPVFRTEGGKDSNVS